MPISWDLSSSRVEDTLGHTSTPAASGMSFKSLPVSFPGLPGLLFVLLRRFQFKAWFGILQSSILIQLRLHSYTVSLLNKSLRGIMQCCRLVGKDEFQLRSELSATVERWAEIRWKCVPDDRSRDGEASLADGRVCPQNEQIAAISRTEWPTWRFRNRPNGLLKVTGKA